MVHRDVKPANCLFLGGELKLGDFGLLTAAGLSASRLGTLRYMPPDGCMDARADVYAAGLVIYEMLTGLGAERFPSLGPRAQAIAEDRRLGRLNRLALRACDPDPSRRFRDAREMLAELTAAERRRRGVAAAWLWLAAGMAIGAALGLFLLRPAEPVSVNFVSDPFEATIYVDGQLLRAPDGDPYHTPCTVPAFPPARITSSSNGTPRATRRTSPAPMVSWTPARSISARIGRSPGDARAIVVPSPFGRGLG